ncbi:bZIP transcription factor [Shewanella sp. JM162201]|uniref:BZIP transcription factor n=1 Tax=Shewanella jiangmenensis TaxID=2837387 RepID=A0ABS5V731_9GAMM|nr:bZIP transcription factor [Shewanella jiangmenensis]MBT1446245.1 bZIP transcription factor [Shewanella jiangmenensis]
MTVLRYSLLGAGCFALGLSAGVWISADQDSSQQDAKALDSQAFSAALEPQPAAERRDPVSSSSTAAQSADTSALLQATEQEHRVEALEQTIANLSRENHYLKAELDEITAEQSKPPSSNPANEDVHAVSEQEAELNLPAPFSGLMANKKGMIAELFNTLQTEPKDDAWAVVMEQRISDFILTHAQSGEVAIEAINCKKTSCEIRGFELTPKGLDKIYEDMVAESWWTFSSTAAAHGKSAQYGEYFYLLTSGV